MKICKIIIILLIFFSAIMISPISSQACSCAEPPSAADELNRSNVVFSGEVVEINEGSRSKKVLFKINEIWKGTDQSHIIVSTGLGGGDCGIGFQVGQNYLVYGRDSSMYSTDYFNTGICDRTDRLVSVKEDLDYLGDGELPTKQVDLTDELNRNFSKGFLKWAGIGVVGLIVIVLGSIWTLNRKRSS